MATDGVREAFGKEAQALPDPLQVLKRFRLILLAPLYPGVVPHQHLATTKIDTGALLLSTLPELAHPHHRSLVGIPLYDIG